MYVGTAPRVLRTKVWQDVDGKKGRPMGPAPGEAKLGARSRSQSRRDRSITARQACGRRR